MTDEKTIRVDKWLKIARFFKKRADASEAVNNGGVKLNGERIKPSKTVRVGDQVTVKKDSRYKNYTVKGISSRSLGAQQAKELYEEKVPEGAAAKASDLIKLLEEQEKSDKKKQRGKPNKKQMRALIRQKYGDV